jgi:hypothetical protein
MLRLPLFVVFGKFPRQRLGWEKDGRGMTEIS